MLLKEIKKGEVGSGLLIENDGYIVHPEHNFNSDGWNVPNPFIVNAVFQKYGIKNANGRIYPEHILRKQVEMYQKVIEEGAAYGECNHPDSSSIDASRISHRITELHWENHTLVGQMELFLSRPFIENGSIFTCGDQVANLILNGYKIGVSSRGVGSVEQQGDVTIVGENFEIICWDVVTTPSTPGSFIDVDKKNLERYIENTDRNFDGTKSMISEKLAKIGEIL